MMIWKENFSISSCYTYDLLFQLENIQWSWWDMTEIALKTTKSTRASLLAIYARFCAVIQRYEMRWVNFKSDLIFFFSENFWRHRLKNVQMENTENFFFVIFFLNFWNFRDFYEFFSYKKLNSFKTIIFTAILLLFTEFYCQKHVH